MRTPRQHAAETAAIMATLPKNDSDIFDSRPSERPRHRDLADECRVLLEWRKLASPEGLLPSSWCAPANDNDYDVGDAEAEWEIRPSVNEIERAVENGGVHAAARLPRKDAYGSPYGAEVESPEDREMAIAALKYVLRYIAGEPVEAAEPHEEHFAPIIFGATESREKRALRDLLREIGASADVPLSDARQRWNLPAAANDNDLAFPWLPTDPREIFYTGRIRANPTASRGGEFNDGIGRRLGELQEAAHIRGKLPSDTVRALDVAIDAHNFSDVGVAFGYRGKNAERRGKQIVRDACSALKAVLASRYEKSPFLRVGNV